MNKEMEGLLPPGFPLSLKMGHAELSLGKAQQGQKNQRTG